MYTNLITTITTTKGSYAKIRFSVELAEYEVTFYDSIGYLPNCDYYTDDLEDAKHTAASELANL